MNYLGIDYGTKRIGLAIASDETAPVPLTTVENLEQVVDIIQKEQIDLVVIGRPKAMSGANQRTDMETETKQFLQNLESKINNLKLTISIEWVDERLSSKGADALGKEFGQSGDRDAVAAMLILDTYLGRIKK